MLTVPRVRRGLRRLDVGPAVPGEPRSGAGVAIILAGEPSHPRVCFMERVRREGDRWSGDVALPGGWAQAEETLLRDAAVRETREEVGITLTPAQHLGDVPALPVSRGHASGAVIGASAFYTGASIPALDPDPREVADAFWVDAATLYSPENRTTVQWSRSGPPRPRPAIACGDRVIWGLTYRVLVRFSALTLGPASPLLLDPD